MHTGYHAQIGAAAQIPIIPSKSIVSFSPIVLQSPGRPVNLELRVTVPASGDDLPIILFCHGQGPHGFAVLQPTHLSSMFLGLKAPEGQELFWQERALDIVRLLDNLDSIEAAVPGLKGRLDRSRVAVAGHSAGAITTTYLLGASNTDPRDGSSWYKPEARIKAGVVLGGTGAGGADISELGKGLIPFYGPDFSRMATPALVVYGDEDISPHLTIRGADWHADPYALAPGPKDLLVLQGAKHGLGGISGWDAGETLDESPERLAVVQRMTWAYLRSQLYEGDDAWAKACKAVQGLEVQATTDSKI